MLIQIIPPDQMVIVDGVDHILNITYPSDVHCIEWDGSSGYVHNIEVDGGLSEENITDFSPYQYIYDTWSAFDTFESTDYWLQDGSNLTTDFYNQEVPTGAITNAPPSDYYTTHDGTNWILDVAVQLAGLKSSVDEISAEKMILPLTIDTHQVLNTDNDYHLMTAHSSSSLTSIGLHLADGSYHTYTTAEYLTMWESVAEYRNLTNANKDALYTALDAAPDPSTVDLTAGWASTTMTTI